MTDTIIIGWIVLCIVMLVHRRLRNEGVAERAPGTWLGIFIQAIGFSVIWMMHRGAESLPQTMAALMSCVADVCGLVAIVLGIAAIWTLGRQWSVDGRIFLDHRLVQHGPYAYVRHPIYTSMFGMLLATGLSLSNILGLAIGIFLFLAGTVIRVHYEEKLLRKRFGLAFDEYAKTVPAFFPRIDLRGSHQT
jgi:protein-S-isoprenylcysteine O-methyltransferase Ste14